MNNKCVCTQMIRQVQDCKHTDRQTRNNTLRWACSIWIPRLCVLTLRSSDLMLFCMPNVAWTVSHVQYIYYPSSDLSQFPILTWYNRLSLHPDLCGMANAKKWYKVARVDSGTIFYVRKNLGRVWRQISSGYTWGSFRIGLPEARALSA